MKKLILVAGVLIAATTAAMAQGYVYYSNPLAPAWESTTTGPAATRDSMPMSASHTRHRRASIGTAPLAIGCTTGAAGRGEATTKNRRDERNKNHNRIGSSGQRCGDSEPNANAKLRAEPA
jgi:hypothetical protein